jgi:hypothetical protein
LAPRRGAPSNASLETAFGVLLVSPAPMASGRPARSSIPHGHREEALSMRLRARRHAGCTVLPRRPSRSSCTYSGGRQGSTSLVRFWCAPRRRRVDTRAEGCGALIALDTATASWVREPSSPPTTPRGLQGGASSGTARSSSDWIGKPRFTDGRSGGATERYLTERTRWGEMAVMERVGRDELPPEDRRALRDLWETLLAQ